MIHAPGRAQLAFKFAIPIFVSQNLGKSGVEDLHRGRV